ncbi:MAG: hypothetical protein U5K76_12310 [Woeseiaceae bacterium]|nr:hypothetical protein [Woeseiaceae bacterium]
MQLPADGEFEVRFTADGKVPGWYVATTELAAPTVSADNGRVAFTAVSIDQSVARQLYTVPAGASPYERISGPFASNAEGVANDAPFAGIFRERPPYQEVVPGTLVYIADQDTPGRKELYLVDLADPGNPVKLSGAEVEALSGQVESFRVSPADPTLIVYYIIASAGDALYLVDTDAPGDPVRIAEPGDYVNYDGDQRAFRLVAGGTAVVYQANSAVSNAIDDGQLFLVELDNPGVATRLNGPIDEGAGEQIRRFDRAGAVSPDGSLVAYSARLVDDPDTAENEFDRGALLLVDVNDPGNPVRIEDDINDSAAGEIAFSPDGAKLVYVRERFDGADDGPLWFADISDPGNPVPGGELDSFVDSDGWWISPGASTW